MKLKEIGYLYMDENRNLYFNDGFGGYFVIIKYERPPKDSITEVIL